jgi:hypothetical protein
MAALLAWSSSCRRLLLEKHPLQLPEIVVIQKVAYHVLRVCRVL